ncbi:MAG: hypothetical protein R2845_11065 [Thermomicrobiales bacterium]
MAMTPERRSGTAAAAPSAVVYRLSARPERELGAIGLLPVDFVPKKALNLGQVLAEENRRGLEAPGPRYV